MWGAFLELIFGCARCSLADLTIFWSISNDSSFKLCKDIDERVGLILAREWPYVSLDAAYSPPEDASREHLLSRLKGPAAPADRQHRIKVQGEGEWHARKHGSSKRGVWRKIHIGADEQTWEV